MRKQKLYIGISIILVLAGIACLYQGCSSSQAGEPQPDLSLVTVTEQGLTVEMHPPRRKIGILEAQLHDLEGNLLAKITRRHQGKPIKIEFVAEIDKNDLGNYYLRFRYAKNQKFQQRSLFYLAEILETTVLGQRQFIADTTPVIRIMVRDRANGTAVPEASVSLELIHQDNIIAKLTAKTDAKGELAAPLQMPDTSVKNATLKVVVKTESSTDTIEETIQVVSALRTLLTTDKPLYQPGQTIHIRALSLIQPSMKPLIDEEVTFEVEDSKGNKVFKQKTRTDKFGISHTDFTLADELNKGALRAKNKAVSTLRFATAVQNKPSCTGTPEPAPPSASCSLSS